MSEALFLQRWKREAPIYSAWGNFVSSKILSEIRNAIGNSASSFVKIPPTPRIKETQSLLDKAFRRGKEYQDPYDDIADKVGVRFVLLTTDNVNKVCSLIEQCSCWMASKDRDFEKEKADNPNLFIYQSMHYIIRNKNEFTYDEQILPASIPCEVQVRTLLQHAWSELSHDIVYKPNTVAASPKVQRLCARAVALVETVDDIFSIVAKSVVDVSKPLEDIMPILRQLYLNFIGGPPSEGSLNIFLLDAYSSVMPINLLDILNDFYINGERQYIIKKIKERRLEQVLYRQSAILLVYYLAANNKHKTKALWPFIPEELHLIYSDLGISFSNL